MKRLLLGALLLTPCACGGIDQIVVEETATSVVEQGTLAEQLTGDLGFGSFVTFDIAETEEFENQGVKKNQIDSVHLQRLQLEITDPPSGQDFTFIDSLEFFVETQELPRERVAYGGPFPDDATLVSLEIDDVDLAPYATAPSMDITTEITGRRPANDTTIEATIELLVDVNVSGVVFGR